jgi:hypothetical protein
MNEISPSAAGVKKVDIMKVAGLDLCPGVTSSGPAPSFTQPLPSLLEARCFKKTLITLPPATPNPLSCPIKLYVIDKDNLQISYIQVLSLREIAVHVLDCEFITKEV